MITIHLSEFQTRSSILLDLRDVDPNDTLAAIRTRIQDRFCDDDHCLMRVFSKWHYELELPTAVTARTPKGTAMRMIEINGDDELRTVAELGIKDEAVLYLEGNTYKLDDIAMGKDLAILNRTLLSVVADLEAAKDKLALMVPGAVFSKYPNQPMKVLWEVLNSKSIDAEFIKKIIFDPRCGIERRSVAGDGAFVTASGISDDVDRHGNYTPLMMATVAGRMDVLNALLDEVTVTRIRGTDVQTSLQNSLFIAAKIGFAPAISAMKGKIVNVDLKNVKDSADRTPAHYAARNGHEKCLMALAVQGSHALIGQDKAGVSPLHLAAKYGRRSCVDFLISCGVDVNAFEKPSPDADGRTTLHWAARNGFGACLVSLIRNGADVNAKDSYGLTPVHLAVKYGNHDCVEILLTNGADPNQSDLNGLTPPHAQAIIDGKPHALEFTTQLIFKRVNLDAKDTKGQTPLHYAAHSNQTDCAELIIKNGAMVDAKDNDGETPLHCAALEGHFKCVELLISMQANINLQQNEGLAPLHLASAHGHTDCIECLIEGGASVNLEDNCGTTALSYAWKHPDACDLLVAKGARETNRKTNSFANSFAQLIFSSSRDNRRSSSRNGASSRYSTMANPSEHNHHTDSLLFASLYSGRECWICL